MCPALLGSTTAPATSSALLRMRLVAPVSVVSLMTSRMKAFLDWFINRAPVPSGDRSPASWIKDPVARVKLHPPVRLDRLRTVQSCLFRHVRQTRLSHRQCSNRRRHTPLPMIPVPVAPETFRTFAFLTRKAPKDLSHLRLQRPFDHPLRRRPHHVLQRISAACRF